MSEKRNENIRGEKKEMGKIRNRHPEDLQRNYSSKKMGTFSFCHISICQLVTSIHFRLERSQVGFLYAKEDCL